MMGSLSLALLLAAAPQDSWPGFPDEVRTGIEKTLEFGKETKFFPASRFDALRSRLDSLRTLEEARRLLRDLTQLAFDMDTGDEWVLRLGNLTRLPGMEALGAGVFPAEIEIQRITLRDGRVLLGTGGPLFRRFPGMASPEAFRGQRYLEPNFGVHGMGNLWISSSDAAKMERVKVPLPKAFLVHPHSETIDDSGRLVIDGDWFRPESGTTRETIALEGGEIQNGGTFFGNEGLGLRSLRPTSRHPELAKSGKLPPGIAEEMGWEIPATKSSPVPAFEALKSRISELRAQSPDIPWPEPFDPDPALAAEVEKRTDLIDGDAVLRLLRLRFALTYGHDLPELAVRDPKAMLELENRVREFLKGGPADPILKIKHDVKTVAAAVRHAPDLEPPPPPGKIGNAHVRFPKVYSPWRIFPLLVVLHGQYCEPEYDFELWGDLADAAGMILVCPAYGSTVGVKRNPESDDEILGIVRRLSLQHNVDPDRIYLTGISMGGAKTWHLSTGDPGRWAAAAPEIHGPTPIDGKYPRLENLRTLPYCICEGEFDGDNTVYSREAAAMLKKWGAPVEYRESKGFGHDRMTWRYPALLRWFGAQKRNAHPQTVEHRAMNAYEGEHAWLAIRKISRPVVWNHRDGGYSTSDLVGVKAELRNGILTIEGVKGKPAEVEIFHDDRIMGGEIEIHAGDRKTKWKPNPSVKKMLERVRATGDRGRLYADSTSVRL